MKVIGDKLYWEYYELAWSRRTCGIRQYFVDAEGNIVGHFESTKKAGYAKIPKNAKYFLRRCWTNKGYPEHTLYSLPELVVITKITRNTTIDDILKLDIPQKLKEFLINDIFG